MGRFSYSPGAGHLLSSFGAWWRVRESPHHAPNDDERVQTGESKRISPPCSLVIQSMVGRFFYSPQAGLSHHHSLHGQEILLLATMRQTMTRYVQPGASKKSPHHALNDDNRAWWDDSLTCLRLDIFHSRSSCTGASAHHVPKDDERCPAWGE